MSRILLIVGGGIAAYKAAELIRLVRKAGHHVTPVLTAGGAHFVTPMSLAALAESPVYTSLWDLKDEAEMGHIQLSRAADLVLVCPATADLLAKMAAGIADDLATTLLLATDKPVVVAPAMNVRMWQHDATQRNVAQLRADGITVLDPDEGPMACGEYGPGRLPEPESILQFFLQQFPFVSSEVEIRPSTSLGTNGECCSKNFKIAAGSGSRPGPNSPHAIGPSSGSRTVIPSARSCATLRIVAACCHMRTFIAGTTITGLSVASSSVVARSSAMPAAIFASRSAVAGQTSTRSAARDSWIWPISASFFKSHSEV